MQVEIRIDQDRCMGIGACVALAPAAVVIGDEGVAEPTGALVDEALGRELCDACPSGALAIAHPTPPES